MTIPRQKTLEDGWKAQLRLGYEQRGDTTVLADNTHCGPLRVQLPLYPEGGVCHTCILHPPGGVVGGDRLSIGVTVNEGAHALITTPGATKFYRSGGRQAAQKQNLLVNGGMLEWFPQDNIIFPGAEAELATSIHIKGDSRFIGWEVLCLGLPTRGETFAEGTLHSCLKLFMDGKPTFIDRLHIDSARDLDSPVGLRGFPVTATLLATGVTREMVADLRERLPQDSPHFLAGLTLHNGILVGRYLGGSTFEARKIFEKIWTGLRPLLAGRDACPPRIWST